MNSALMRPQALSRLISSLLVIVHCGIITAAFVYQYTTNQAPCPLCFLQRVAMIGIAVGQLLNFRFGIKMSHHAISLFHCVFGAGVSLRQISLHVCPGSPTFGTPVLGYGLYTWALISFVCSIIAIGGLMLLYNPSWKPFHSKALTLMERFAFLFTLAIIIADIVSIGMICGFTPCPDNP
ncbi:MAG: disulfide bond formation protein B [Chlamydiales bacterium]|nr:disulfide bond formation protein B [Chlamydiales bacterium]